MPSLINRFYVLDLMADRSLLRWMAARPAEAPGGPADRLRPMVLEWGTPGDLERSFTLTDYITKRLVPALEQAVEEAGGPVPVVGYCMGGLLAVAVAQLMPNRVSGLALLATPWDFHAGGPTLPVAAAAMCQPLVEFAGELPVYAIQALFATHDPFLVLRKFRAFADIDPESDKAAAFVALEDWLNDGVALAGPVALECLQGWYGENTPMRRRWTVAGERIDPRTLELPTLLVVPRADRIVPPGSAMGLAQELADVQILRPPLGHIGMVASARAKDRVWERLAAWLDQHSF